MTPDHDPNQTPDTTSTIVLSSDERTWGMLCHLASFSGCLIPLGSILGPLLVWCLKKDTYSFVNDQGKEALNFQITMLIAFCVSAILAIVLIGFVFLAVLVLIDLIFTIVAAIKANEGEHYRYPYAIRFIR